MLFRPSGPKLVVIEGERFFFRSAVDHSSERAVSYGQSLSPGFCGRSVKQTVVVFQSDQLLQESVIIT